MGRTASDIASPGAIRLHFIHASVPVCRGGMVMASVRQKPGGATVTVDRVPERGFAIRFPQPPFADGISGARVCSLLHGYRFGGLKPGLQTGGLAWGTVIPI